MHDAAGPPPTLPSPITRLPTGRSGIARRYYDKFRQITGVSKTSAEAAKQSRQTLIIFLIISPILILYWAGNWLFDFVTETIDAPEAVAYLLPTAIVVAFCSALRHGFVSIAERVAAPPPAESGFFTGVKELLPGGDFAGHGEAGHSYPLNDEEARHLLATLDEASVVLLRAMVANSFKGIIAALSWDNVRQVTGSRLWAQFAAGPMRSIHRELRAVTGDPEAVLLLDSRKLGLDEEGAERSVVIYGRAVATLRRHIG